MRPRERRVVVAFIAGIVLLRPAYVRGSGRKNDSPAVAAPDKSQTGDDSAATIHDLANSHPFSEFGKSTGNDSAATIHDLANSRPFSEFGNDSHPMQPDKIPKGAPQSSPPSPTPSTPYVGSSEPPDGPPASTDDDAPDPKDPPADDREDAGENFPNLIKAYMAKHGSHGRWLYAVGHSQPRALEFVAIDAAHMKKEAPQRFTACASFLDVANRRSVRLEATADFTEAEWRVISIKPRSRSGPCVD